MKIKLSILFLISFMMVACSNEPLKAPCDEHAHFCGMKTKINHW